MIPGEKARKNMIFQTYCQMGSAVLQYLLSIKKEMQANDRKRKME
jgi:hypothetical protein